MGSTEIVETAECRCCGMWEECTAEYICWVKERFGGAWVCGLCEVAIKDEQARLGVGVEAALRVHTEFMEAAGIDPTIRTVQSLLQLLKKMIKENNPGSRSCCNLGGTS